MNNVIQLYNNYFYFHKKNQDNDENLKKKLKKNELDPKQFKMTDEKNKIVELPEWLKSKNYFNKAVKLINDVRPDINNVKLSSDKK